MKFLSVEWHDSLPSTNDFLLMRLNQSELPEPPSGTVIAARSQSSGRGRAAREWTSVPGRDLTFSFLYHTTAAPQKLVSLAMAVSLAITDTLAARGIFAQTKWPNDVLVRGKKIAGILVERVPKNDSAVIVGIGVNINMSVAEAACIDRSATSVCLETGEEARVEDILAPLLDALLPRVSAWEEAGFAGLREDWLVRVSSLNENIQVGHGEQRQSGVLTGFGEYGELLLTTEPDTTKAIWSGELEPARKSAI